MGQVFFKAFIAAIGGLIAWLIWEPQFPANSGSAEWAMNERWLMLTMGVLVGGALGGLNGWAQGSKTHAIRMGLLGALCGAVAAVLGHSLGGALRPGDPRNALPVTIMLRTIALGVMGAALGGGIGLAGATGRRVVVGVLGGLIGGAISGAVFDILCEVLSPLVLQLKGGIQTTVNGVPTTSAEAGIAGRAVMSVVLPLFIGLFMGILDRVVRTAWLRLNLGRNEGKEWVVDSAQTYIGRSESAQVPLFGDNNIAPLHACITRQGNTYILMDSGSPLGTLVNGQRVTQAPLFDGSQIQVGQYVLTFMMRAGSAPQKAMEQLRASAGFAPRAAVQDPYATPQQPVAPQQPVGQPGSLFAQQPQASQPTMMQPMPQGVAQMAPASQPAMPTLVVISGPLSGQRFPVAQVIEAGRETPGISLSFDTMASRRHASFAFTPTGVIVTDLGSTNGTFVNDQRIQQQTTIRPGDTVRIGTTVFRLE